MNEEKIWVVIYIDPDGEIGVVEVFNNHHSAVLFAEAVQGFIFMRTVKV